MEYAWSEIVDRLNKALRIHYTPIGIKLFDSVEEMERIPKLRRPKHLHAPCQILSQAVQLGFTVGFTLDDIVNTNCAATTGFLVQDEEFRSGKIFAGGWCATPEDAAAHHGNLTAVPNPTAGAVASPLVSGRIAEPDACLLMLLPGEAFMLLHGFVRHDFKPIPFSFTGESSCSMHWVRTCRTGEIGLTLPCFAEMRFAGYPPNVVNLTMRPADLVKALEGLEELNGSGFRYPVPDYAVQMDVCEGVGASYELKKQKK